jgi:hypothetical protein
VLARRPYRLVSLGMAVLAGASLGLTACLAPPPTPSPPTGPRVVTYSVAVDGAVWSDVNQLAQVVADTYADARGWHAAGVDFQRVASGGDFTVVLAESGHLPNYDPVCTVEWSCQVGRSVVINDARYLFGSPNWPGPIEEYRRMVINHETGHWLGLGHSFCPGAGAPAPVMQQQSIDMQGCAINPWPLPSELDTVRR